MWLVKTSPNICFMIEMVKDIWRIFEFLDALASLDLKLSLSQ